MAETKKTDLSNLLHNTRETFMNTINSLTNFEKMIETTISSFLGKNISAQNSSGKLLRDFVLTAQKITDSFTERLEEVLSKNYTLLDNLPEFPYKAEMEKVTKQIFDNINEAFSMLKVYPREV